MKKLIIIALAVCGMAFVSTKAFAVHAGAGDLTCGQCHTMHNSEGNATMGGNSGGSLVLLRGAVTTRADMHLFCLECHAENGSQKDVLMAPQSITPPKVWRSTIWTTAGDFESIGAGGDFGVGGNGVLTTAWALNTWDGSTNYSIGYGHSLGAATVTPPGASEAAITSFSCTNCHDPHGAKTSNSDTFVFRNLKVKPVGGGGAAAADPQVMTALTVGAWVGAAGTNWRGSTGATAANYTGTAIADHYWPVIKTDGLSANNYAAPATQGSLTDGMSAWCAQCHDLWHQENNSDTGANQSTNDWLRHPVDTGWAAGNSGVSTLSGASVTIVDSGHLGQTYGKLAKGFKLPTTSGTANAYYDTTNGRVFCLSCHFAHGGPFPNGLRWSHAAQGTAAAAASAIPSDTGCQQCHNRGGTLGS